MSVDSRLRNEVLALAALFQAVGEVRDVAENGRSDPQRVETCITGLLRTFEGDVAEVYGGDTALSAGLSQLQRQLANPRDMDQTRYVVMSVHLERKLMRRRDMLKTLADGLDVARGQAEQFGITHENVIGRLADLYGQTISQLRPRIMVQGERVWLEDPRNANLVRALLLAGIRAATLGRASGANRLRLIIGRNRLVQATTQLIQELH